VDFSYIAIEDIQIICTNYFKTGALTFFFFRFSFYINFYGPNRGLFLLEILLAM
jgi:hypothetical protein